jgi:hypothetical protein
MKDMYHIKEQPKVVSFLEEKFKYDISGNETLLELSNKIIDSQLKYSEYYKNISSKFIKK